MRYGHSNRGLIGVTETERAISRWSLSKPIVMQMLEDLHDVVTPYNPKKGRIIDSHKDERPAKIEGRAIKMHPPTSSRRSSH